MGLMVAVFSVLTLSSLTDNADADTRREFRDSRYRLERSYPVHGHVVRKLPPHHRTVIHKGSRYYFHDGAWFRAHSGGHFVVVAPPIGLFVNFLPPYYATVWVRGVPYYYANNIYYSHYADGYRVVEPPEENAVSQTPPPADQLFIYPRHGQNEKQQADDRYQCHVWAVDQTGFDPTRPQTGSSTEQRNDKHADYQRALAACLDGRGYTVK